MRAFRRMMKFDLLEYQRHRFKPCQASVGTAFDLRAFSNLP